jgi:hypothetical protein
MKKRRVAIRVGLLAPMAFGTVLLFGCSDGTGPRWIQTIDIGPDSVYLEPGETGFFKVVKVLDQYGNELSDEWIPRVKWTVLTPALLSAEKMDDSLAVTALKEGTGGIRAELGRDRQDAIAYIRPPGLGRVEIDPSPVTVSLLTGEVRAYVRLFDTDGAEMEAGGFRLSWNTADTTVAWIPNRLNSYLFARIRGRRVGQTRVSVNVSGTRVATDVFVIQEPAPPSEPRVTAMSSSSLEVIWNRVWKADAGYRVYRSASAGGPYTQVGSTGSATGEAYRDTTFVDTGLSPSTTYFFAIEACHPAVGCSPRSPPGSGTTAAGG